MNRNIILTACIIASTAHSQAPATAESQKAWKLDWQIAAKVQKVIHDEPAFAGMSIQSTVKNRIVTLFGNVNNDAAKVLASTEVGNVDDVKTVLNNLNVVTRTAPPTPATPQPIAPVGATGPKTITLPVGTVLSVRTIDGLTTKTAKAGDVFHGTTTATLARDGFTLIPAGTPVTGHVVDAQPAAHFSGAALLSIELASVRLSGPTGPQDVQVVTKPLTNKAAARGANTAEKTGGGAAAGAIIGALAGGGKGAGIGAASGGVLGAGSNAVTRGKEVELKPEQLLSFYIDAPLDITIMLKDGSQVATVNARAPIGAVSDSGVGPPK